MEKFLDPEVLLTEISVKFVGNYTFTHMANMVRIFGFLFIELINYIIYQICILWSHKC